MSNYGYRSSPAAVYVHPENWNDFWGRAAPFVLVRAGSAWVRMAQLRGDYWRLVTPATFPEPVGLGATR